MQILNLDIRVPSRKSQVRIVAVGCLHYGAAGCDEALMDWWIKYTLKKPDTYMVLGGDLVDSINEKDKRWLREECAAWCYDDEHKSLGTTIIDRQRNYLLRKLKPLAQAGRILCILEGNHERKLKARDSIDLTYEWSRALGVPYGGYACLANLRIKHGTRSNKGKKWANAKERDYTGASLVRLYLTHGSGASQTKGAVMNKVSGMLDKFDVDAALMWHLHQRMSITRRVMGLTEPRLIGGKVRSRFRLRDRIAAVCGTFLDSHKEGVPGYGETKGYEPIVPGPSVLHIAMEGGDGNEAADTAKRGDVDRPVRYTRLWVSEPVMGGVE